MFSSLRFRGGRRFVLTPLASFLAFVSLSVSSPRADETAGKSPQEWLGAAVAQLTAILQPPAGAAPRTLTTAVKVVTAEGMGSGLAGHEATLSFQAPDRIRLKTEVEGRTLELGRLGQQLWLYAPAAKFGVKGVAGVPRFATEPERKDTTVLGPLVPPLPKEQLLLLPLLFKVEALPVETLDGTRCAHLRATPQPQAIEAFKLPKGELELWVRESDFLLAGLGARDEQGHRIVLHFLGLKVTEPATDASWELRPAADAQVETVALAHLVRFVPAALSLLNLHVPTLRPATGSRRVLATEGAGRLEDHDGTKVLFLKGTPEEMGRQHGKLMRAQVRDLVEKILYGVGVGSSFEKGRWFFGEIEQAQARLNPFVNPRYLREMDAMAQAVDLDREELRLANFFPELFHCSGFAVFGSATVGGRLYHGRILDYLRGVGLEPNAVVIVHQPDQGHAWANVSYAGFVGSVTAMNARRISIGEMGGRGEGQWDGKPMAQLVRDVMEQAGTLDEAIAIMQRGPRTCEYYYVIADGNTKQAVGIASTPSTFEIVRPGQAHPRLPHAIPDAVLMSAGDRYEKLAERVQARRGQLDDEGARRLMDRPVAMTSNIHAVLFAPETLDFWVANADSRNVASACRYTHYNLGDLLKAEPLTATASR